MIEQGCLRAAVAVGRPLRAGVRPLQNSSKSTSAWCTTGPANARACMSCSHTSTARMRCCSPNQDSCCHLTDNCQTGAGGRASCLAALLLYTYVQGVKSLANAWGGPIQQHPTQSYRAHAATTTTTVWPTHPHTQHICSRHMPDTARASGRSQDDDAVRSAYVHATLFAGLTAARHPMCMSDPMALNT